MASSVAAVEAKTHTTDSARRAATESVKAEAASAVGDSPKAVVKREAVVCAGEDVVSGRERLKRHRRDVAGMVRIPETWEQERLLKDWADSSVLDRSLYPSGLVSAREALVEECRRAASGRVRLCNSC